MTASRIPKSLQGTNSTEFDLRADSLDARLQSDLSQVARPEVPKEEIASPVGPFTRRRDLVFGDDLQDDVRAKLRLHRLHLSDGRLRGGSSMKNV